MGFIVWDDDCYGPENGFSAGTRKTLREPLYRPALPFHRRNVGYVLTAALEPAVPELVRHYEDVLRLSREHGRPLRRSSFWLRPFIFSPGEFEVPFDRYDTRDDAETLLDALEATADRVVFDDVEQGWEVNIFAAEGRLFIRHANFDTQEELACVQCDRDALVRQIPPLRARLHRILAELRAALGVDYWSRGTPFSGEWDGG